jgi:hypothetical protein
MDWLTQNHVEIICNEKVFRISLPSGEALSVKGERTSTITGIISFPKAQECVQEGHTTILAVLDEKPSEEWKIKDISVVRDFPEVFPEDLPGLPPYRQVKFGIELTPGAVR